MATFRDRDFAVVICTDVGIFEYVMVVGLMFAFAAARTAVFFGGWPEAAGGSFDTFPSRLSWIFLYVPLTVLILRHWRQIVAVARWTPGLGLLISACFTSALWSISPDDTARRSFALLMTTGFGYYLSVRFDHKSLLELVAWALTIVTGASLVVGLLFPHVGIMHVDHPGAWRGLFTHKNAFGYVAALDLLTLSLVPLAVARHRLWVLLGLAVAVVALILSQSLTATITFTVAIVSVPVIATLRTPGRFSIPGTLLFVAVGMIGLGLLSMFLDDFLAAIGRDRTLTGRTWLWQETWQFLIERPLLGYGYGVFWTVDSGPSADIRTTLDWPAANVHNGYLDLWLELGMVGLLLFAWSLIGAAAGLLPRLRTGDAAGIYWSIAFLVFLLIQNMVESQLLLQNDLTMVLYVATLGMIGRMGVRPSD